MKEIPDDLMFSPPEEEYPLITREVVVPKDTPKEEITKRVDKMIDYIFIGRVEEILGRAPDPKIDIKKYNIAIEANPDNPNEQVTKFEGQAILWLRKLRPQTKGKNIKHIIQYRRMGK